MSGFGRFLLIVGAVLAVFGVFSLDDAPQIVGGDAFNYIIGAVRGVGWIAAGGVCSLFGIGVLLLEQNYAAKDARKPTQSSTPETEAEQSPFAISQE